MGVMYALWGVTLDSFRTCRLSWLTSISGSGCQNTQTDDGWHSWDSLPIFLCLRGLSTILPSLEAGGYLMDFLYVGSGLPRHVLREQATWLLYLSSTHLINHTASFPQRTCLKLSQNPAYFLRYGTLTPFVSWRIIKNIVGRTMGWNTLAHAPSLEHTIYPVVYTSVNFSGHVSGHQRFILRLHCKYRGVVLLSHTAPEEHGLLSTRNTAN